MQSIKMFGLAIVAVLALGAVTATAASAEEFIASKTGKLKGHALTTQKFKTGGGATVNCTEASSSGEVKELKSLTQEITVIYSKCTIAGTIVAEVSLADYLFMVSPTFVKVLNIITINVPSVGCHITVEPTGNEDLTAVTYKNNSGKIIEETAVTKITSTSSAKTVAEEEVCGKSSIEGTYTGNNEIELEGGTIEVK